MITNKAYIFIIFVIVGIIIGIIFDFFRILRKSFKTRDFITYIEDIIFWIISGIILIYAMCKFTDGELRFYTIIGLSLGAIIYLLTVSKYVIKISVFVINILKKILLYPLLIIFKIYKNIKNVKKLQKK